MIIFIIPKNTGLSNCNEIISKYKLKGDIIKVRGEDVPLFVLNLLKQNKKVIGITGNDLFEEFSLKTKDKSLTILEKIKWNDSNFIYEKPTLCLLGPKNKKLEDLAKNIIICINKKYSLIAKNYLLNLQKKGFSFSRIYLSGATEEAFECKLSDLIIDIVCSGKSAEKAGLEIYDKIFESDIVIIGRKK